MSPPPTETYTLSLHDALPILIWNVGRAAASLSSASRMPNKKRSTPATGSDPSARTNARSEEHTSELQSRQYLVCRLLLEKKKKSSTPLLPTTARASSQRRCSK